MSDKRANVNVHGAFAPRSVDELVALTRVLLDLFNATRTTALNGDGHFSLTEKVA